MKICSDFIPVQKQQRKVKRMNKADLIDKASQRTGLTKKDTEASLNAVLEIISEALVKNEKVVLARFGVFETKVRAARTARNPKANLPVKVAPTKVCQFKPGKNLKAAISSKK